MAILKDYDSFAEWFNLVELDVDVYPRFCIPCDEWLFEYIDNIDNISEEEVKELLRKLLIPYTRKLDQMDYDFFISNKNTNDDMTRERCNNLMKIEKYRRLENGQSAWEGLTWVLQLLPFNPYKAIKALNIYSNAEVGYMSDDRIIGLDQCVKIIEAKFIYTNQGQESSIYKLKPREFEWLIDILYNKIGYETMLTPATRDGGKDIVACINREDGREIVYVECKLYKTTELTIDTVRSFGYGVIKDNINRGVLFCTGYVNDKLKTLDSRIQIWALEDIIVLLNAHVGSDWSNRLKLLIGVQRRKYKN